MTGTPIRDSLSDFHGLMVFLGIDPYNMEQWWRRCLCVPYISGQTAKLEALLAKYLWRTAKRDVLHQIDIPEQTEEIHFLQFSPIEEHFYRRQHIECAHDVSLTTVLNVSIVAKTYDVLLLCTFLLYQVQRKINRFGLNLGMSMSELDRKTLGLILQPIIKLRQACCHPQIVKGMNMNMQKSTLTMEQLLENMIKKVTNEIEVI